MGKGKFEPDTTLNRAMVATVLYRLSGDKVSATNAFPDVPANEWYGEAVAWAQQKGIVTGFEDGTFRPMEEDVYKRQAEDRPGKPGQRPHAPRALKRLCRPAPQAQRPGKAERQPARGGRSLQCGGRQRAGLPREHRRAERKQHHSRPDPSHNHRVPLPDIFCSTIWKAFPNFA